MSVPASPLPPAPAAAGPGDVAPPVMPSRPALALLLFAALAVRLAIAWQPLEWLVTHVMPDDAFYYLHIARHIAAGDGVTFDGVELTNGFHPLWMAMLVPLYRMVGSNGVLGVHLALALAAVLDLVTIWLLVRTVSRLTGVATAGLAAACWYAFNPAVLTQVGNGLETAVNLLCLSVLFAWGMAGRRRESLGMRWWVGFGGVAGVAMLARSDNVVPVMVIGLGVCLVPWRPARIRGLVLAAVTSAIWQAPWLWWNGRNFGRFLQTSAGAYGVVTRGNLAAEGHGTATIVWYAVRDTYVLFVRTIPLDLVGESKAIGIGLGVIVALLAIGGLQAVGRSVRGMALPATAACALLLVNSLGRGTLKVWYVAPAALVVAYGIGIVWQLVAQGPGSRRARALAGVTLAAAVLTGFGLNGATVWQRGLYPWQAELLAGGRWLAERTPPDTVAGSFNSGIVGYVAERTVVNLDGLVNTAAADAARERRLGAYMASRGVGVLVDNSYTLYRDYRRFYGPDWQPEQRLELVEDFALPGAAWAGRHVGAYRLRP